MEQDNLVLRLETENDYRKTENLVREAFWNVYKPGCNEHYVLHTFRKRPEFVPEQDFVMEKDEKILLDYSMEKAAAIYLDKGGK